MFMLEMFWAWCSRLVPLIVYHLKCGVVVSGGESQFSILGLSSGFRAPSPPPRSSSDPAFDPAQTEKPNRARSKRAYVPHAPRVPQLSSSIFAHARQFRPVSPPGESSSLLSARVHLLYVTYFYQRSHFWMEIKRRRSVFDTQSPPSLYRVFLFDANGDYYCSTYQSMRWIDAVCMGIFVFETHFLARI